MKQFLKLFMLFLISTFVLDFELIAQHHKEPIVDVEKLVDSLNVALFRHYIFPEKSKAIADYLRVRLKQKAYRNMTDPSKLTTQLQEDIYFVHKDRHMRIYYEPGFENEMKRPGVPSLREDSMQLHNEKVNNFSFKRVEILAGNIGYIEFTGFSRFIDEAKPTLTAAFRFLSNAEAIIIDLRNNGGGSPWMVRQISSYLVNERTRLNDIYDRRANKTGEFWADPVDAENMKLSMPVYILTGRHTFSAAEDFAYAMQVNKRAEIVGDTTGGGAHPTGPVSIGQGYVIDIPFARSINYITKTDWEGTGIFPNHPCNTEQAMMKAQQLIFEKRINYATTDQDRAHIQWFIRSLQVHEYDNSINIKELKEYEGTYDRFKVFVKDGKLYLDDNGGRTFLLKPISSTVYLGSDWFQVEFLSSPGKIPQMKMLGKPGWVNIHDKKK